MVFVKLLTVQRVTFFVYSVDGNENRFLREFVGCVPHSAGCRLARWLQPESIVEPDSCELSLSTTEVRCGWPAKFTVRTRDQYGNLVQSNGLKVSSLTLNRTKIIFNSSSNNNNKIMYVVVSYAILQIA